MRTVTDLSTYLNLTPSQLADTLLRCPECGREHKIPFKRIQHGVDRVQNLGEVIRGLLGREPDQVGVIYDEQIAAKLEDLFFELFSRTGLSCKRVPVGEVGRLLVAEVELGDWIAGQLPPNVDFLVGVGSGVISDLTKWAATQAGLPFILVGTAASMNAYTSITGSMTENQIKTSKWLNPADGVVLDSGLLASAPREMTAAGVGDLLARNVADADWMLSHLLRGTYYCSVPFQMMAGYQANMLQGVHALAEGDLDAMDDLAQAVLISGYSMAVLDGQTSPSSGAEHILSHFFDFQHDLFGLPKNFHGTQVGLGSLITVQMFEMLREMSPADFDLDGLVAKRPSLDALARDHARLFGDKAPIFDENAARKRIPDSDFRSYLLDLFASWDEIWSAVDPLLIPGAELRLAMEAIGGVTTLSGLSRSKDDAIQALVYGSTYRSRYTILDLFWELGLLPEVAPVILERAGVLD